MMDHRDPHTCFPSCVSTPSPRGPLSLLPTYMVPQPPVPAPISSLGCPLFRRKSKEVIMEKQNFVGLVCSYSLVSFYFQLNTGHCMQLRLRPLQCPGLCALPGFHLPMAVHSSSPCLSAPVALASGFFFVFPKVIHCSFSYSNGTLFYPSFFL